GPDGGPGLLSGSRPACDTPRGVRRRHRHHRLGRPARAGTASRDVVREAILLRALSRRLMRLGDPDGTGRPETKEGGASLMGLPPSRRDAVAQMLSSALAADQAQAEGADTEQCQAAGHRHVAPRRRIYRAKAIEVDVTGVAAVWAVRGEQGQREV